jgi:hypothetical protein
MLAGRVRVLDCGFCIPGLDDDHGEPGQLESVPRLSRPLVTDDVLLLNFYITAYMTSLRTERDHVYRMVMGRRIAYVIPLLRRYGVWAE